MDNNVQVQRKTVSMYIREDILSEVDKWLAEKKKKPAVNSPEAVSLKKRS